MKFETKTKALGYGIDFSHGLRRALVHALMLIYFLSLGFNVIAVTSLFAISTLIMTFFEFPTGAVADYDSRKKSLLISFFLMFLAFLGIFAFKDFWILAGFWILGDIAWTFCSGAQSAWIIDELNYGKEKKKLIKLTSKEYGFEKAGHLLGGLIGFIVVAISFRFIWLVISLFYLLLFLISWRYMEERNFKPEKTPHNYLKKSFLKAKESFIYIIHKQNRDLRILMWSHFLIVIGFSGFYIGTPLLFTQILGLGPEYLSGIYSLVAVFVIAGPLVAHKFVSKYRFGRTLFSFTILMGLSLVALALSKSLIVAILIFALFKIAEVIFDVILDSAHSHEFDSKIRASLGSIQSIVWAIANSIGVFLTGLSITFIGITPTLIISGVIMLLTAVTYLWMKE